MDGAMVKRGRGRPRSATSTLVRMPHPYDPAVELLCGRRPGSETWEAIVRLADGQTIGPRSLGTDDPMRAPHEATVLKARLEAELAAGREVTSARPKEAKEFPPGSFGAAAAILIASLEAKRDAILAEKGAAKAHAAQTLINRLNHVLIPQFGRMRMRDITADTLHEWAEAYRVRSVPQDEDSPLVEPSQSTMGNLAHAFSLVSEVAVRKRWITSEQRVRISKKGYDPGEARPPFTQAEVTALAKAMTPAWCSAPALRGVSRGNRTILRAYVAVAAQTGMRPGTEIDRLTWGQLGATVTVGRVVFTLQRKQGKVWKPRSVLAYQGPSAVFRLTVELERLARFQGFSGLGATPPGALMFARPGANGTVPALRGTFSDLLTELGMKNEPASGKERSLYSLRHYYGTEAAVRGVDMYRLARQMGTSTTMLLRYYDHSDLERHAPMLTGEVEWQARVGEGEERPEEEDGGAPDPADL